MTGAALVTVDEVNAFLDADFAGGQSNRCTDLGPGWATGVLHPGPDRLRPGGIISGPTVFGLCDAVLYYACFTVIGLEPMTLTSEMSIRYLRPAIGEVLVAPCRHRQRRSAQHRRQHRRLDRRRGQARGHVPGHLRAPPLASGGWLTDRPSPSPTATCPPIS